MATYAEIEAAAGHEPLRQKVRVACAIAAEAIRTESDQTPLHSARLVWAKNAFKNPRGAAEDIINAVLAQNAGATFAQITGASDATVQTAVNNAVNAFLD